MTKAALFDLDGVVFDTEPQYTEFWNQELKHDLPDTLHVTPTSIKGQTLAQIFSRYFNGKPDLQKLIVNRLDVFERNMHFDYIPGFPQFLSNLRAHGIKTAVVTSSNLDKMRNVYRAHPDFETSFDHIFMAEDFTKSKPDPECYLIAAKYFGFQPEECVGFEDSFNGLKAVRAAGMTVVGLATTNSEEAIKPYCDYIFKDYTQWTHRIPPFM